MIGAIIRWSGRNVAPILIATAAIVGVGLYAVANTPLDAIPDLSDPQVIVYTDYPGQAPQVVEDQVTYPLTTALLTVPKAKVVRGLSFFGVSFVYVVFEDGTDVYWARSRVLEYLNSAQKGLPAGVTPALGPDASGVGWVFEYAVIGAKRTLAELRTIQDWFIRYQLATAGGVAEVAGVGGFVKQYQVVVDPNKLRAYGIPLSKITDAIRASNMDVGGSTIEMTEREYMVRGHGYLRGMEDLEQIQLKSSQGTPVLLRDVARIELGPAERRGLTELNGEGEVVAGIVLQRDSANALTVIKNVKDRIAAIAGSLPTGVKILSVYDRSGLIHRAVNTLTHTLIEESIIVALVCMIFLMHARSALVAIVMLPVAVLISLAAMRWLGVTLNIMSLGDGGCGHCDDRKCPQASGTRAARRTTNNHVGAGRHGSRPRPVLQPAGAHSVLFTHLYAGGSGRAAVQAAGLHPHLCAWRRGAAFHHVSTGFDEAVRARPDHAGK
jgi:Cu(I)/Ag(I) efflux system membrane protein CusA/SilA